MAYTYLQLRNATANVLGKTDGGTDSTTRDNAINDVCRSEIPSAYPFSWLRKTNSAISLDANGRSDLPSDYDPFHRLLLSKVFAGQGGDTLFTEVPREIYDHYGASASRFYIDYNTSTNLYRLNTTAASITAQIVYQSIPAIMTTITDVSPIPDKDVVAFLAAARYWLASERDETNHDRFKALGSQKLMQLISSDKKANPLRLKRGSVWGANLGWNRG